jgi:hypothetical protein
MIDEYDPNFSWDEGKAAQLCELVAKTRPLGEGLYHFAGAILNIAMCNNFEHMERWLRGGGFPTEGAEAILKLMSEWVIEEKEAVVRWRQREKEFNRHSGIMRPL